MRVRQIALMLLGVALVTARPVRAQTNQGHYREFGDAVGFLNILPPGSDGVLNGAEAIAAQAERTRRTRAISSTCTAISSTRRPV